MAFLQVNELTTARYQTTLLDEAGDGILSGSFVSLSLTLYNLETGAVINSRNSQNVLNANNVTISGSGLLTWTLQPNDNSIIGSEKTEHHKAMFEGIYSTNKAVRTEIGIVVTNLTKVP